VSTAVRWIIVLAVALLVVGLLALARGPEHRRGDEAGALASVGATRP
jgi:hypothetical protein